MPLITIEELKRNNQAFLKNAGNLSVFSDMLDELNGVDQSYLKEEVGKYSKAIDTIRKHSSKSPKEIQDALNTMSGFKDFLNQELKGKTVYQRLVDDQKLIDGYDLGDKQKFDKSLTALSDYLGLDIKIDELEKRSQEVGIDEKFNLRPTITEKVETVEQYKAALAQGKNFLEFGSGEYGYVSNFNKEIKNLIDKLNDKKELNEFEFKRNAKEVELLEKLTTYHAAVKTLQEAPNQLPFNEAGVKEALENISDLGMFFSTYDDKGKTNYHYLQDIAKEQGVNLKNFNIGVRNINKTLQISADIDKIVGLKAKKITVLTAEQWTKNYKEYIKYNYESAKASKGYPEKFFSTMMAARMISNSVRGDASTLDAKINSVELENKAEELLNNPTYKEFIEMVKNDPKMLAKAEKCAKTGHGGGLDDMFKEFLLNKPAGELDNEELLGRYMPKALDRIEVLQNQAKELAKNGQTPEKQIAEILAIRDISNSIRGKKDSLDKPIPTDRSLADEAKAIADDQFIKDYARRDNVLGQIKDGHGGLLSEQIFKANSEIKKGKTLLDALTGNRYSNRMGNNADNAAILKDKIASEMAKPNPNKKELDKLCKLGKDLIAEQVAIYTVYKNTEASADEQIDWKQVEKIKNGILKNEQFDSIIFKNDNPETIKNELETFGKAIAAGKYVNKVLDRLAEGVNEAPGLEGPGNKVKANNTGFHK